jgi:hypothetical protein
MSIGDKLRAIDEHAGNPVPANPPSQKEAAEGSRETVVGSGITNRPPNEERQSQKRVPRRGKTKEQENA